MKEHRHKFEQAIYKEVIIAESYQTRTETEYRNYIYCECGEIRELY